MRLSDSSLRHLTYYTDINLSYNLQWYRRIYQYNEDDFRYQFDVFQAVKHRSQKKLSIKKLLFDYL